MAFFKMKTSQIDIENDENSIFFIQCFMHFLLPNFLPFSSIANGQQGTPVLSSTFRKDTNTDLQTKTVRNRHRKRQNFDNF